MRRLLLALISFSLVAVVALPVPASALPSSVAATPNGAGILDVTWTASGDPAVVDYLVEADQGGGAVASIVVAAPATSAQLTGLGNNETYTVTVTARDGVPTALGSDDVSATTATQAPSGATLALTAVTSTSMTATFSAADGGGTNVWTVVVSTGGSAVQTIPNAVSPLSITGLDPSTLYSVQATADNGVGTTSQTETATTSAPPVVAPSNVVVTIGAETDTSVPVSWSADDGGGTNSYTVSISPNDGGGAGALSGSSATSTTFTGLNPNTAYTVTVVADNGVAPTASNTGAAMTEPPPVVAPSNATIGLSAVTSTSMLATFSADDGGGTNVYTITVRTGSASGPIVQGPATRTSPATISGLSPNVEYFVTVSAANGVGTAATATDSATTSFGSAGAPTGVTATLSGTDGEDVTVSWTAPANTGGGLGNYTVRLSNGQSLTVGSGSTSVTFNSVAAGATVSATVQSSNGAGVPGSVSASSGNVTTSTTPGVVRNLTAAWAGEDNLNSIDVDWDAPTFDGDSGSQVSISGYVISVSPAIENAIPDVPAGQTSVTISGLEQGVSYVVTVRAKNPIGNSGATSAAAVLVPSTPGTVTNIAIAQSPPFSSGITVTWELPEEDGGSPITGYLVTVDDRPAIRVGPEVTSQDFNDLPIGFHNVTIQATTVVGTGATVTSPNFEVKGFPPFDSEEAFVTQLYADFLRRTPDAGGLAFWTERVADDGSNVQVIVEAFMRSPEFAPRRAVARMYYAYLARQPDPGGFDFWTRRIARGQATIEDVSQEFALSPEFIQATRIEDPPESGQFRPLTDAEFIVYVYSALLNRRPDQEGFEFWLDRLNSGLNRGTLMTSFSESPENIELSRSAVDVTVTYFGLLQRAPETECNEELNPGCVPGFEFWTGEVSGSGGGLTNLIRQFYFSPEYADRVNR